MLQSIALVLEAVNDAKFKRVKEMPEAGALLPMLTVVEEAPTQSRQVQASGSRRGAAPEAEGGQAWRIRFLGSYTSVLRALRALQRIDSPCFPQGLSVAEPQPGADWRDWTLTLALL